MKKSRFLIFLMFLLQLFSLVSFAQSTVKDTVDARLERAKEMIQNDAGAALELMESTLRYSIKNQNKESQWDAIQAIGFFYLKVNQLDDALAMFQKNVTVAKEMNDAESEGLSLMNIGNTYLRLRRLEQSKSNYVEALNIFKKIDAKIKQGKALGNLGNVNTALGLHEEGIANFREAYEIFDELGKEDLKSQMNLNIGYFYLMSNQGEASLPYVKRGLEYSLKKVNLIK